MRRTARIFCGALALTLLAVESVDAQDLEPAGSAALLASTEATPPIRYEPWSGAPAEEPGALPLRQAPTEDDRSELLFSGRTSHGGYGGPQLKMSAVLDDPALLIGAQGGWVVNHSFVLGLAGYGLASRHEVPAATRVDGERSDLGFGYGGVRAAYLLFPRRLVHVGIGALVGAGGLAAVSRREYDSGDGERERHADHGDALFVLEPEVEAELNVVRFMRMALTVSYRYVGAVDAPGMSSRKLSFPSGSLVFRFGAF